MTINGFSPRKAKRKAIIEKIYASALAECGGNALAATELAATLLDTTTEEIARLIPGAVQQGASEV